jgi:hypothetical protein
MLLFDHASVAVGLANSAFSAIKNALELAKKTTDLELKHQINTAFDNVLELKAEVYELAEENRLLQQRLTEKATITRNDRSGYFYKEGDDSPLCPKCYQGPDHAVVYLQPLSHNMRYCTVCGMNQ